MKIKSLKKLPRGWDKEGYQYVGALMEDVQSNFRSFGETLSLVSEKVDSTHKEVGIIKERQTSMEMKQTSMEMKQTSMEMNIIEMKGDVKAISRELKSIKNEMAEIKLLLTEKADIERLFNLEERVKKLEESLHIAG